MRAVKKTSIAMVLIAAIVTASMITGPIVNANSAIKAKAKKVSAKIIISNATVPDHHYAGMSFAVKGKIVSAFKLTYIRCGVRTAKGKWVNGVNVIVNPKKKRYNLKKLDRRVPFALLKAGEYRYSVEAKNTKGKRNVLVNRSFTVSKIYGKKITKPSSRHLAGTPFTMNGKVKSKFGLKRVYVGVTTKSGKWIKGFYKIKKYRIKKSKNRTFDIAEVDPLIKFGHLSAGTYRYKVYATDEYGQEKYVVDKKFKVGRVTSNTNSSYRSAAGTIRKSGYRLSYPAGVIEAIGAQPVSGPCGQYAMAYARAIIDGRFPLNSKYKSYYRQLYNEYGFKSHYAYWYKASGSPVWYQTNRNCYRAVLKEIVNGRPCIINLHNNGTGNNHFVTVIGYVPGTTYDNVSLKRFIALDPGNGRLVYLKDMNYTDSDNPEAVFF